MSSMIYTNSNFSPSETITGDFPHLEGGEWGYSVPWALETYRVTTDWTTVPVVTGAAEVHASPMYVERCKYCRTKHRHDDKFCDGCGAPL